MCVYLMGVRVCVYGEHVRSASTHASSTIYTHRIHVTCVYTHTRNQYKLHGTAFSGARMRARGNRTATTTAWWPWPLSRVPIVCACVCACVVELLISVCVRCVRMSYSHLLVGPRSAVAAGERVSRRTQPQSAAMLFATLLPPATPKPRQTNRV